MFDLNGRVVLVTGGSGDIGAALCEKFALAGAKVAMTSRTGSAGLARVLETLRAHAAETLSISMDVRQRSDVEAGVAKVVETWGRLDVLVNNAGITKDTLLLRMNDQQWNDVLETNLTSVFLCTQAALKPMLKARWGRIISITSIVGEVGNAGQANYASAKAGIIGFTKTAAKECASRNITVNAIAPGFIESRMTDTIPEKVRATLLASIPLGRPGTPMEVAAAAVFLASEEASYITGHVLNVDGGIAM